VNSTAARAVPLNVQLTRALMLLPCARQGSPDAPRCGFSARVVSTLRGMDVPFGYFDILEDQAVREGMKVSRPVLSLAVLASVRFNCRRGSASCAADKHHETCCFSWRWDFHGSDRLTHILSFCALTARSLLGIREI